MNVNIIGVCLIVSTCLFLFPAASAVCSEIYVPDDYPTIQAAIDNAAHGDTVIVRPGTYPEDITFRGQAIEVKSSVGAEHTVIQGEVVFNNDETNKSILDGFTIDGQGEARFGIEIYRASPVVRNNIVRHHLRPGIYIDREESSPLIQNNVIRDNTSQYSGGGIAAWYGSTPIIVGNTIFNNVSTSASVWNGGGGIAVGEFAEPTIESNVFIGNKSTSVGGAMHCAWYARVHISNNYFLNNSASRGGVISFTEPAIQTLGDGGDPEVFFNNNLFVGNQSERGCIDYNGWAVNTIQYINCTFTANTGNFFSYGSGSVFRDCIFWGNDCAVSEDVTYSIVEGGYPGTGNIDSDPLFVIGPGGSHYLSQVAAGQSEDSPGLDSGSASASSVCFQLHDSEMCLDELTTRTDQTLDSGQVDIGFHYYPDAKPTPCSIVTGLGPHQANPTTVRLFFPYQDATHYQEFSTYSVPKYGVNITCGNVLGEVGNAIITGPGPGAVFGPHVRGFASNGTQLPGLSFLAYGTNKYGVNVATGDLDGDGFDEILTGPGPGEVFGPHVRAFDYDGGPEVSPVPGVNFFAYGTLKWGVNVTAGDLDSDGYDEIVTGAGPGPVFGAHVRGWNVDGGTAAAIPGISFFAYNTPRYGVVVSCGDVDGDGIEEIVTAPGPSPAFGSHIRGWDYDGEDLVELPGLNYFAWPAEEVRYGAKVWAGTDLDGDGTCEIIVGGGSDPGTGSAVLVFDYLDGQVILDFSLDAFPPVYTHGVNVAAGRL